MRKYRKGREIIDQVAEDLSSYDDQGLIDYTKLYKVLRKCNAALGEKINPEKEEVVQIKNFRGYLPEDFYNLNFAFICRERTFNVKPPQGFHVEYKTICKHENKCKPCLTECDNDYVIFQYLDDNWTQYKNLELVRVDPKSFSKCKADCPNLFAKSGNEFEIADDGMITTNFETGAIYLNYVGNLEDLDEDLLIIDHPLVEPYYEAELIRQILKNIVYNKDGEVVQLYGDAKIEASRARTQAMNFINMPEYTEIRDLYQNQRKRLYDKYFRPIL